MPHALPLARYRTLAFLAANDAGKTTATERLLVRAAGPAADGEPTLSSAATACLWRDHLLTLVDSPSYQPQINEIDALLPVIDGGVLLVDAVDGCDAVTDAAAAGARRRNVPLVVFANKLDRVEADWRRLLADLTARLGAAVCAVQLPVRTDAGLVVIDLVGGCLVDWRGRTGDPGAVLPIPADHAAMVAEAQGEITRRAGDLSHAAVRAAVLAGKLIPVIGGSAFGNWGVWALLDAIVDYLPAPLDRAPFAGTTLAGAETTRHSDLGAAFSAIAFRAVRDPALGAVTFVRVISGQIAAGTVAMNANQNTSETIGRIVRLYPHHRETLAVARAGDVVGITGLAFTRIGDTLCDPADPILYPNPLRPETGSLAPHAISA